MENSKESILRSLEPMFRNAREQKLLIRSNYQGILFTPDELENRQKNGQFVWGLVNWELISPQIEYDRLKKIADSHVRTAETFRLNHNLKG